MGNLLKENFSLSVEHFEDSLSHLRTVRCLELPSSSQSRRDLDKQLPPWQKHPSVREEILDLEISKTQGP